MDKLQQKLLALAGAAEEETRPAEMGMEDFLELLADQEYRLCLMELGVTRDDL